MLKESGVKSTGKPTNRNEETLKDPFEIIAHFSPDDGRAQSLTDHLRETARRAGEFAANFGAAAWGRAAGLLHDDGKASPAFQRRIRGADIRVDHSTPGAKYAVERLKAPKGVGKLLAYCIAGHHAGLSDGNSGDDETCLAKRLTRGAPSPGHLAAELPPAFETPPIPRPPADAERRGFGAAFFTRMLYSALVDADFLDTEAFLDPEKGKKRGIAPDLADLKRKLDVHLSKLTAQAEPTEINRQRARILAECRAAALLKPGLFSLSVPTGGGKTLSSLAFAMDHALRYGLRRIIYVIPYTSIIEQTAQVFRDIFGPDAVLEHHSNILQERDDGDEEMEERRRLATENWDVPVVVTTNVQFFESFFANHSSRARKLHNTARAVVILDEAQMLPVPLLRPTLAVIRELAASYGTSLVLCTATQPALTANDDFKGGLEGVREIMSDPAGLERLFVRVNPSHLGQTSDEEIVRLIRSHERCLCIVNTRKHARVLFQALAGEKGLFHLSAAMCPAHRSRILGDLHHPDDGTIRRSLVDGGPCRVVSTQLVEAGVDVDFPVVIRAMAGIDSIVQAAGRCNREGRVMGGGRFFIFAPGDALPPVPFRQNAQIAQLVWRGREDRLLGSETVRAYFKELYWLKDRGGGLDAEGLMPLFSAGAISGDFPFKSVAANYRLIPAAQLPIILPYDEEAAALCEQLRYNTRPGAILRRLQPYTVQVYPQVLACLKEAGYVETLQEERFSLLAELGMREVYDQHFGLNPEIKEFCEVENLII